MHKAHLNVVVGVEDVVDVKGPGGPLDVRCVFPGPIRKLLEDLQNLLNFDGDAIPRCSPWKVLVYFYPLC